MTATLSYACACGTVRLRVRNVTPKGATRAVCYCVDCQTAPRHLGHADMLDANGGTDLMQIDPGDLSIEAGRNRLTPLQLSPRGLYRWHATCCGAPMINTANTPRLPFTSVITHWIEGDAERQLPAPIARINLVGAYGDTAPAEYGFPRLILRFLRRAIVGTLTGGFKRSPLWDWPSKSPLAEPIILTKDQRHLAAERPPHV